MTEFYLLEKLKCPWFLAYTSYLQKWEELSEMRFTVLVFLISTVNLFSQDFTELEVWTLHKTDVDKNKKIRPGKNWNLN